MPGGLHPPKSVTATWKPNYVNPETRGWGLPASLIALYLVAFLAVVFRLLGRLVYIHNAGLDDLFIVIALIFLTGFISTMAASFRLWGYSNHSWDLRPGQGVTARKVGLAIDTQYTVTTLFIKVSILLFYRRFSSDIVTPRLHWALRGTIAFIVITHVAIQISLVTTCKPLYAFWMMVDPNWSASHVMGKDYHCDSEGTIILCSIALVSVQDFMTIALPMTLLSKIKLPFRQKVCLTIIFSLGIVTCSCAIIRIWYVYQIYYASYDVSWWAGPAFATSGYEACLGVICASIPTLRVFFRKFFGESSPYNTSPARSYQLSWNNKTKANL